MNSRLLRFAALPLFALTLAGCGAPDPTEDASATLDDVFKMLKRSDLEGALMLYSPSFFKTTPRQGWLEQLQKIHGTLGPVQSYEIQDTAVEKRTDPAPGVYVGFTCRVIYQRGALIESIVMVRPEGLQSFTISGHGITQPQQQGSPAGTAPQQAPPQPQQPQQPQPAPSQPQAPPATPQAPPATPQTPPATPQTPPATPQTPPATPQTPPATPQTPPPAAPPAPVPAPAQ